MNLKTFFYRGRRLQMLMTHWDWRKQSRGTLTASSNKQRFVLDLSPHVEG